MKSDIKLDDTQVVVEGHALKAQTWDLMLDHPDRRKNDTPHRRALVHDHNDGLTVNWDNDYPGGVTLNGVRTLKKHPSSVAAIALVGGLSVAEGALHLLKGQKLILSDDTPTDDWASGEVFQTGDGLELNGGQYNNGANRKPVTVHTLVAQKTIKWGDWSTASVDRLATRVHSDSDPSTRRVATTLVAGADAPRAALGRPPLRGSQPVAFDIVDTLIGILDELSALREQLAQLPAPPNS